MKLHIEESSWSGWTRDYKPNVKNYEYDIVLNKKYIVKTEKVKKLFFSKDRESFSFVIEDIGEDYVIIKVNSSILQYNSVQMEIKLNETIELTTPTMDCGEIYKISLK